MCLMLAVNGGYLVKPLDWLALLAWEGISFAKHPLVYSRSSSIAPSSCTLISIIK